MLTNIQNQVLAGSRVLASANKRAKIETQPPKKAGPTERKRGHEAGGNEPKSHKIDLMKASLMTDIRIENRLAQQARQ